MPHAFDDMQKRIDALEITVAHQANTIEDLSDTVRQQWERIEALTKSQLRLRDRVTEVEEAGGGTGEQFNKPHY